MREDNLSYFIDPVYREIYSKGESSYYDQVELECPICKKQYYSTYGNRFDKEGNPKGTLLCKSCSISTGKTVKSEPKEGETFGQLTFLHRADDYITPSGKHYIQYLCRCDCGKEIVVRKDHLLSGATTKCKDCKTSFLRIQSIKKGKRSDPPLGTRFGKLVFLEKTYHQDKLGRNVQYYKCQCDCGNTIETHKFSILKGLTTSCGCAGSRTTLRDTRIKIGNVSDPEIGTRFGHLTVQKILLPEVGKEREIECLCDCGNVVNIRKSSLLNGKHRTCGNCPRIYPQWFIDRLIDPEQKQRAIEKKILPKRVFVNCFKCNKQIEVSVNSMVNLTTMGQKRLGCCKKCSHQTSLKEKEILDFLLSLNIPRDKILTNVRNVIKGKERNQYRELDFYLPDYHLAIEYNGNYYHSDLKKPRLYHFEKFSMCEKIGIRLISIFEMDWNISKDKIKNLIKYSILPKERIPARKCVVKSVSIQEAWDFYDTYHIQNKSCLAKINYGLYYKDSLVAVMGFGSSSFHNRQYNEGDYELHRFVTKTGLTVVGGASKLLSLFEREYHPAFLLSYSWNDWYDGTMYSKLGFTLDKSVPPDYFWILNDECINKRKCRLKNLSKQYPELYEEAIEKNVSNKEDFIMESLGAVKVYRSGSKRWVKKYST